MAYIHNPDVKQYIKDVCSVGYFNRKIIYINNLLEDISTQLIGVSSASPRDFYIENKKPYSHSRIIELMTKEENLIIERDRYVNRILELENIFNSLDEQIQKCMISFYILKENHDLAARQFNFSRQAMYKKINNAIKKSLK